MSAVAGTLLATAVPAALSSPARVVRLADRVSPTGHPTTSTPAHLTLITTLPPGDRITRYSVTFGDVSRKLTASKGSGLKVPKTLAHHYGRAGRYLVTFAVTDAHRHTATAKTQLVVAATSLGSGAATTAVGVPVRVTPVTTPTDTFSLPVAPGTAGVGDGWGSNDLGQANGVATVGVSGCRCAPVPGAVASLGPATSLVGGLDDGYALRQDGTVWAWGINDVGELGNGTSTNSATPVRVGSLGGISAITAGTETGYALKSDGTVWAWGDDTYGELADGASGAGSMSMTPVRVGTLTHVTAIAAGADSAYALRDDGTVWGWGYNDDSELATSRSTNDCTCVPAVSQISNLTSVTNKAKAIGAGAFSGYAVLADGTVGGWGLNINGQVGSGLSTTTSGQGSCDSPCEPQPMRVTGVTGAVAVAGGYSTGYALLGNGTVWSWGANTSGETGNGTATPITSGCGCVPTPAAVPGLSGVTAVAATGSDGYALRGGTVLSWGDDSSGELGNNTVTTTANGCSCSATATVIPKLTGIVSLGNGAGATAFAIKAS